MIPQRISVSFGQFDIATTLELTRADNFTSFIIVKLSIIVMFLGESHLPTYL